MCVCVHHQRPHCQINFIRLFVACFQIIFKSVVDSTTKAGFFFVDSVTVDTVVHRESEACQKQCVISRDSKYTDRKRPERGEVMIT